MMDTGSPSIQHRRHVIAWGIVNTLLLFAVAIAIWMLAAPGYTAEVETSGAFASSQTEVRFQFDRPVSREMTAVIEPGVAGNWTFENFLLSPHLSRTLVFEPEVSWAPDTEYTVTLSGVRNALTRRQASENVVISFHTPPPATVAGVLPAAGEVLAPTATWQVNLSGPNDGSRNFEFVFSPETAFTAELNDEQTAYTVKPLSRLLQGTDYTLTVSGRDVQYNLSDRSVAYQSDPQTLFTGTWKTREAPGISSFTPTGDRAKKTDRIAVTFSESTDVASVQANTKILPELAGSWETTDNTTFSYQSADLAYGTTYAVAFASDITTLSGGYLPAEAVYSFTTLGNAKVSHTSPAYGFTGVDVGSSIRVTFDQAVERGSAEAAFSVTPDIAGTFSWDDTTMTFQPSDPLAFNTGYSIRVSAGVKSTEALDSNQEYSFSFTTELSQTKLAVPFHRQERPLSCEAATLVMALRYRGINVSESTLIDKIGFDPTPHVGNVWGNPHIAFVGDYYGRQATTGYGVYWQPIARVASQYRSSRWFTNGTVQDLTAEIKKGNPVIVWGNVGSGQRVDWKTPDGGNVVAIIGEHTRVVTGYIGSADNPTSIITMDPLSGERYFSRSAFEANWATLGKAGVVVE